MLRPASHPDLVPVEPGDADVEAIMTPVSRYVRNELLPRVRARRHESGETPTPKKPADPMSDSAVFSVVTRSMPPEFEDADGKRHLLRAVISD